MKRAENTPIRATLETLGASLRQLDIGIRTEFVVAYSGGVDSTALMWAVSRLAHSRLHLVEVIHVDHRLREGSGDAARRAMEVVRGLGMRGRILRVDCEGEGGVEARARRARYEALARAAEGRPILTAHTADDQAETILYRLSKGAGLAGAGGIRRKVRLFGGLVLRPLLGVTRAQLEEVVSFASLPIMEDPTNRTRLYARNRLRLDVLPSLEVAIPGASASLARAAELAQRDDAFLSELAQRSRDGLEIEGGLDAAELASLPFPLSSRIVREVVREAGGQVPTARQVEEFLLLGGRDGEIHLASGLVIRNRRGTFLVEEIDEEKGRRGGIPRSRIIGQVERPCRAVSESGDRPDGETAG